MTTKPVTPIAFVFPGQGSQSVGMGKDFFDQSETARKVYEAFDAQIPGLSQICFEGPEESLKQTRYTQPAILATSIAALMLFNEQLSLVPAVGAGHSLGEYGALFAAQVIDLDTAVQLVKKRAELMDAAPAGAMSAVLGLASDKIEAVLKTVDGIATIANYNTPDQVVITGEPAALEAAVPLLKEAGAKRVLPLSVGGAFHSPLMTPAAEEFKGFLKNYTFKDAIFTVVTNTDAMETIKGELFQQKLGEQIDHSVRWTQSMDIMVAQQEIETVIEFGPGKVLTGMFKKTSPEVNVYNVYDMASLQSTVEALKVGAHVGV